MNSMNSDDRAARKKGSLLDRIEERAIQDGRSLGGRRRGEEEAPDSERSPITGPAPLEEPDGPAPFMVSPDFDLAESAIFDDEQETPKRKAGGLLDRLSSRAESADVQPQATEQPLEHPSQPPLDRPLPQEAGTEAAEDSEDLPGFLREMEDAYGSHVPAESESIFDETLPISPEAQQMMGEGEPPQPATASQTPSSGPFSGGFDQITYMDATPSGLTTGDHVMGAEVDEAMERLREKMAKVAMEFAEGKINQAQFQAIYNRYQEQRIITEQLLARDPTTDAWQQVLTEGHTTFLRSRFEARVLGYTLHDNQSGDAIVAHGQFGLSAEQLAHLLQGFYSATARAFGGGMRSTIIEDGRWVLFVPGRYTTGIMIFTLQPSEGQLRLVSDLHEDFERANEPALASGNFSPEALVYPQRFLLQDLGD